MKSFNKVFLIIIFLCGYLFPVSAQNNKELNKYHRSSLYSILLKHPEKQYCNEMIEAFKSIPIPDRYNNHDLKIKVISSPILRTLTKEEVVTQINILKKSKHMKSPYSQRGKTKKKRK